MRLAKLYLNFNKLNKCISILEMLKLKQSNARVSNSNSSNTSKKESYFTTIIPSMFTFNSTNQNTDNTTRYYINLYYFTYMDYETCKFVVRFFIKYNFKSFHCPHFVCRNPGSPAMGQSLRMNNMMNDIGLISLLNIQFEVEVPIGKRYLLHILIIHI